jgi:hypothetical protein
MKKILKFFLSSFDNYTKGSSGRKLSAFAAVSTAVFLAYKHTDVTNLNSVLITLLVFALFCLGLVTADQLIKFMNSKNKKDENQDNI